MSSWNRPDSLPYPAVWRRAEGKKPVDGKVPSFILQDVPEDRQEELLDFVVEHFLKNEPLCKCLDVFRQDQVGVKEYRDFWAQVLAQRISIVAFVENDGPRPRIAAANIISVVNRAHKKNKPKFKGELVQKFIKLLNDLDEMADPFEKYGVEEYIRARSFVVAEEFQGQGLGTELLKAWFEVSRAVKVNLVVTSFTAMPSKVLASREGFEELARITYADCKVDGKEVFPGVQSDCAKLMAKWVE